MNYSTISERYYSGSQWKLSITFVFWILKNVIEKDIFEFNNISSILLFEFKRKTLGI